MSQPTIQEAIEVNGSSAEATAIVTALDDVATAIAAASTAGKLGGADGGNVDNTVQAQMLDELIDYAERLGSNLTP